ncbi:Ti-type conjugative transfer relaxase TraA [Jannaschia sp. CCS1]|uniref:Ti-type conjugative transfer relaxase TraA n=1 Tax=Jannaschia sp. (strain CCS1) TaxID=290400 RepID=UPI00006BFF5B|nr:Ti-type conjugative transfer relaxase TraA [Jannaschia sp. CCS1]ABD54460.1 plasmid mobilization system relaxase [Jannaschia sp. CCS1]ABD57142.1 MobA/MobL protein [Jannaschia sp. CCS1]
MAIYHLHVKVIGRAAGSSAVASAAYRSASRLRDDRIERSHDFTAKRGVVHSEVMLSENAPEAWGDREQLWNAVEAGELRKDAQLAREVEFAIPREMTQAQSIALARDFVQSEFVAQGMIADLNVHWERGEDGTLKPHAHVMLTMREVEGDGFGQKVRDWNRTALIERWRECWADLANARMAELDIDARIDHRSLEDQGIALEPQSQIGAPAQRIAGEGSAADRAEMHREIARDNGERIIANPALALEAITHQQSTFTDRDMARFAHRHSDGIDQFNAVLDEVRRAPNLVALGQDGRGEDRFTTRAMVEAERRLHRAAHRMAKTDRHNVREDLRKAAMAHAEERGLVLSGEQADALAHVTGGRDLGLVIGPAGTGKGAMLGVAREAWEVEGYRVRGAALSGIAAEGLEGGSGIVSRTIASLEHGWERGRDTLTTRDILVIDEAGMVGTRQLERVLSHAVDAGAKVVLVGDPQQLQSIEAGAAFRALHERYGGARIDEVRRQHEDWQREATRDLASGHVGMAIQTYDGHDMVHAAETRQQAREDLIDRWDRERQAAPDESRIILTHTNAEVQALNELAREKMRAVGDLGEEVDLSVERGDRRFASGDRVMFLQNDRGLGVKNGTLGTIEAVSVRSMTVQADGGRAITFDLKDYDRIDHGYAATIHKAQGMTVDRTHVLATPGLDAHSSYVALSRHRNGVDLHYGQDDFATTARLIRTLSRDRAKEMALDYEAEDPMQAYAERRGISFKDRVIEIAHKVLPEKLRDGVDGLLTGARSPGDGATGREGEPGPRRDTATAMDRPLEGPSPASEPGGDPEKAVRIARTKALVRHAQAFDAVISAEEAEFRTNPTYKQELTAARKAFEEVRPYGWHDAEAAYAKEPTLAHEAGSGQVNRTIRALHMETELRTDQTRADSFVERWQKLDRANERHYQEGNYAKRESTQEAMQGMARSLERDPQLESLLANRKRDLGITFDTGHKSLGRDLAINHGLDHELSRSRGLSR